MYITTTPPCNLLLLCKRCGGFLLHGFVFRNTDHSRYNNAEMVETSVHEFDSNRRLMLENALSKFFILVDCSERY